MWKNSLSNKKPTLEVLCFGGEDWWYHNRGHTDMQLMRRFARKGTVLYVNSILMQKPNFSEGRKFVQKLKRKTKSIAAGLKRSDAGFWVYSPVSLPLHHISWNRSLNEIIVQHQLRRVIHKLDMHKQIIWVVCPTACNIALGLRENKLVYQRSDRFEDYPNVDVEMIKKYDRKLKAEADLTIYVNRNLYEQETNQCNKAIYLDQGVDFEMFASAEQDPDIPADIAEIQRPIVGYFGALDDHKLDIDFVKTIVEMLPTISFVFVGKASPEFSRLADKKNVWLLGQKLYEQIPHFGKCFNVAIIPWKQNQWTEATNPIKFKEYLALGKPIVSTPAFTELQDYLDVVYQAQTPQSFAKCIKIALQQNSPESVAARRARVAESSWDRKAQLVLEQLSGID